MQNNIVALLLAVFLVLLAGCGAKPVFSKVIDDSMAGKAPPVAKIVGDEHGVVSIKNDAASNIEIRVQKIRSACSTERARSLGSDFDGYILFEVYKDGSLVAKAQMDFKTEPTKKDFETVWSELARTLGWGA